MDNCGELTTIRNPIVSEEVKHKSDFASSSDVTGNEALTSAKIQQTKEAVESPQLPASINGKRKPGNRKKLKNTSPFSKVKPDDRPTPTPSNQISVGQKPINTGRRRRLDRGLPLDTDIRKLAVAYQDRQRQLWPEAVKRGYLPTPTDEALDIMVESFKRRFISGKLEASGLPSSNVPWKSLGSCYERYSCDNSNPRSLDDQLDLQLQRAKRDNVFIPWEYVYADASITGTIAARAGYRMAKALIAVPGSATPAIFYIDEIGRASRDGIEALRLGNLLKSHGKRMIGVSDGFDSANESSRMMLYFFAMFNEWFVEQLRKKVQRGMMGAARRGTSTGLPPLGIKLVPAIDKSGNPIIGQDGTPTNTYAIDTEWFWAVETAFRMFVVDRVSINGIARKFNELRVKDRTSWTAASIKKILICRKYVGIVIYNQTYSDIDSETGVRTVKQRPRSEWNVRRHRALQAIPWKTWRATRKRLLEVRAASPLTGKSFEPKAHLYPTTLLDGIIVCECGHPMRLFRSCGKYQQFYCPNGNESKHDCTFKGSKSVAIVEKAILDYVSNDILSPARIEEIVKRANVFIVDESKKPRADANQMQSALRAAETEASRLHRLIRQYEDGNDMSEYLQEENKAKAVAADLRKQLCEIERNNVTVPPLTKESVELRVKHLRELLKTDVANSSAALRDLLGTLVVTQHPIKGKQRKLWLAHGRSNLPLTLAGVGSKSRDPVDYPDSLTWEYLRQRNWTIPQKVEIPIAKPARYEQLAEQVKAMRLAGKSISDVARAFGIDWLGAQAAVDFAESGKRPKWKAGKRTGKGSVLKYKKLATEVYERRQRGESFKKMASALGANEATVIRAYDYASGTFKTEVPDGRKPSRGTFTHLPKERFDEIRRLLTGGMKPKDVAQCVGVGQSTVNRERKKMAIGSTSEALS